MPPESCSGNLKNAVSILMRLYFSEMISMSTLFWTQPTVGKILPFYSIGTTSSFLRKSSEEELPQVLKFKDPLPNSGAFSSHRMLVDTSPFHIYLSAHFCDPVKSCVSFGTA